MRKQILVPDALDKKIRRRARKRGISQSALVVEAVEAFLTPQVTPTIYPSSASLKAHRRGSRSLSTRFTADALGSEARGG
jgi:hypothetical protein